MPHPDEKANRDVPTQLERAKYLRAKFLAVCHAMVSPEGLERGVTLEDLEQLRAHHDEIVAACQRLGHAMLYASAPRVDDLTAPRVHRPDQEADRWRPHLLVVSGPGLPGRLLEELAETYDVTIDNPDVSSGKGKSKSCSLAKRITSGTYDGVVLVRRELSHSLSDVLCTACDDAGVKWQVTNPSRESLKGTVNNVAVTCRLRRERG